jgi:heptosyltransferase-2
MSGVRLPGRLLVDLPNWVGDQVMAMPAVRRLEEANRGGETVLHCRPPVRRLFELLFPTAAIAASARRSFPFTTARRLCRGGGRFDVGITFRHASRAKLLLRVAARHTLGSAGGGAEVLLSRTFEVDRRRHQLFDADPILSELGLPGVDPEWRPELPRRLQQEGEQQLRRLGLGGEKLVGLAPAAAWGASKQWPAARFGRLATELLQHGLQPVLLIGPGEDDVALEVCTAAGAKLPVVGADVDVAGLAGAMVHLAAAVCNDSGPMHLGAMIGVRIVALFGPTDPVRTAPIGSAHRVISRALECAPCLEPLCPLEHNACLHELEPRTVTEAVLQVVA